MPQAKVKPQVKQQQKYELQSNNTTIILTHSMREIDECWQKSNSCTLYQFNADGSKFKVNSKKKRLRNGMIKTKIKVKHPKATRIKNKIKVKTSKTGKRIIRSKSNEQE